MTMCVPLISSTSGAASPIRRIAQGPAALSTARALMMKDAPSASTATWG